MENLSNVVHSRAIFRTTSRIKTVFLLLSALLLWSATVQAQQVPMPKTFYWFGKANNKTDSFDNGNNWSESLTGTPTGRIPAPTDILVFRGGIGAVFPLGGIIIDFGNGSDAIQQTIAQMRIESGGIPATAVNLLFSAPTTGGTGALLNMVGGTGITNVFSIGAGSSLGLVSSGSTNNRFIDFIISTGQTALIAGNLTVNLANGTPDRFIARNATIKFASTATCTLATSSGNFFGTTGDATFTTSRKNSAGVLLTDFTDNTTANSLIFETGATLIQQSGSLDPFGPGTTSVAKFEPGSFYTYQGGTFAPKGHTYGNLTFEGGLGTTTTVDGTNQMLVVNNLTMTSGVTNLNLTGTDMGTNAAVSIGGDLIINSGSALNFSPTSGSTVAFNNLMSQLNAPKLQNISSAGVGPGTLSFNSFTILEINNEAGLKLNRPITVSGGLRFTLGLLNTTTTNLLSLPSTILATNISGGKNSDTKGLGGSFVKGPVAYTTAPTLSGSTPQPTNFSLLFPVGGVGRFTDAAPKGMQNYRPMTLVTTNQTSNTTYTGEQIEATAGGQTGVDPTLDHVSSVRYFRITPSVNGVITSPTGGLLGSPFGATVELTFGPDDYVTNPALASFVVAKRTPPLLWTDIGRSDYSASTLTSASFTSFSDFSLASKEKSNGFPGTNPLPVELTRFAATAQANGIGLGWATAQEKNNDRFEVQRSADGATFETVGTVKGQGSSTSAHEYAFADNRPLIGLAYYRLRQVDFDGSSAFSTVVTVRWDQDRGLAYPNPSSGSVTLAPGLGAVAYRVFNNLGQTVLQGQATGNERLDLTRLPLGPYLLELTGQNGRSTQRLLRQ